MVQQFEILLFLSLLLLSYQQQLAQQEKCVSGQNCPYDKGMCIGEFCKCNEGYYSYNDPTLPPGQPKKYCNYEQISHFQPAILEFVFLGHFSIGRYWLGIIKVLLVVTYFSLTYYIHRDFRLPKIFKPLFECLFPKLLPRGAGAESIFEKILDYFREALGSIASLWYFADLFLYQFNVYKDGNGVPLV